MSLQIIMMIMSRSALTEFRQRTLTECHQSDQRSKTEATFEWRSLAAARASRKKRSRADSSPRYRSLMTFRVTGQRRLISNALLRDPHRTAP